MIEDRMKAPEWGETQSSLVVLCDTSGSMHGEPIKRLRRELTAALADAPGARVLAFATGAHWVTGPEALPDADGGTNLTVGLKLALTVWPATALVISDGLPDDQGSALALAAEFPGEVSTLFVGGDGTERDRRGLEFLRLLARKGAGTFCHRDIHRNMSITGAVRALLALEGPAPIQQGGQP